MVSKLDQQTFSSEFESHWVSHSYGLVSHLSKKSLVNYSIIKEKPDLKEVTEAAAMIRQTTTTTTTKLISRIDLLNNST